MRALQKPLIQYSKQWNNIVKPFVHFDLWSLKKIALMSLFTNQPPITSWNFFLSYERYGKNMVCYGTLRSLSIDCLSVCLFYSVYRSNLSVCLFCPSVFSVYDCCVCHFCLSVIFACLSFLPVCHFCLFVFYVSLLFKNEKDFLFYSYE